MKTSIIISTCEAPARTQECIESIRKHTECNQYEIILVIHSAKDNAHIYQENQPDIKILTTESNPGGYHEYNQAINIASGDNILLLKDDVSVTENWLTNLIQCLYSSQKIAAVGPLEHNCGCDPTAPAAATQSNPERWEEALSLTGFCLLIKKQVIDEIGLFDEEFVPGSFGDADYSFRIRLAGYKLFLCKDTLIQHFNSVTLTNSAALLNRDRFIAKWGFDLAYSTGIRHDLIRFIDKPADYPLRVLEIGCACGRTLLQIKNSYKQAELYGIEYGDRPAAIAATLASVRAADIEKTVLDYPEQFFDYIILGDVLEHLVNPWQVLETIHVYLKPDGYVLAGLPNVMHFSVVRNLLLGNWTYETAGLLDQTHLRFFTLNEIRKLFKNAGYALESWQPVIIYETEADQQFMRALVNISGNDQLIEQYRAYQYLLKAAKAASALVISHQPAADVQPLIFLLRRLEQEIDTNKNQMTLIQYITDYHIPSTQILEAINKGTINKEAMVLSVAMACCVNGLTVYGRDILKQACKINPPSISTMNLLKTLCCLDTIADR